jgi:hypothetical protein
VTTIATMVLPIIDDPTWGAWAWLVRPQGPRGPAMPVSDGKPLTEIIERVDRAMKQAGISSAKRCEFREGVPEQYALAVDFIREWVETD